MTNRQNPPKKEADYYSHDRADMLAYIPQQVKTVLEVGCGSGEFSRGIRNKSDVKIWGVELNSAAAERARQHIDTVLCGPIETQLNELPDNYFDCICMNDVIEHLIDPWQVLASLRKKLRSNGVIVASIPNIRHYKNLSNLVLRGDWQYTESGTLDRTHLRFFTHNSIPAMFNEAGYSVETIEGVKRSRKFKLKVLNILTGGKFWDIPYLQFAIVAKPTFDTP